MKRGTLYIADPDCELRCAGPWLRLERDGECLARAATAALGHVMLIGDVLLTPGAINTLLRHDVPVSFLDRRGRFRGRLVPPETPTPSLRQAQYRCAEDPLYALDFARAIVGAKIASAQALLRRHGRNCTDPSGLVSLRDFSRQAAAAHSLSVLRGIEGRAAAAYFTSLRACLKRPAFFPARMRRPPTDPINALLSFGYSILTAEVTAQVCAVGLDPQVGFMHVGRAGRPALALDLVEEFRIPVVDRVVLRCWNLGIIGDGDFETDDEDVPWLQRYARKRFLHEYEQRMMTPFRHVAGFWTTQRRLLYGQARAVAAALRAGEPYRPLPVRL